MKIASPGSFSPPQSKIQSTPPGPPNPDGPKDQVSLGERIGNGVLRGGKALLPGAVAGVAGAALGTAGFYTVNFGARVGLSMTPEFPGFIAVGGAVGAGVASLVEASAGEGTQASLTRAAITGASVGAATGVALQLIMWSRPF